MRYFLSILLVFGLLASIFDTAYAKKRPTRKSTKSSSTKNKSNSDIIRLQQWMTGYFSSQAQAAKDSDYFDVRLRMTPIWKDRKDGFWLYVEQAMAENESRPYRQRVYHVTQINDTTFESAVFAFSDPAPYIGEWQKPEPLAGLTPDSLISKTGCSIILYKHGEFAFSGSTVGKECASDLRGADYTTSEVTISKNQIISWDRGFDMDGNQVWGARKGGYVFKKLQGF
ncbi:MAG: hypothetical protein GX409_00255 [candidate division Zixibacteria bacterium]|nr:hypothetical protein [candidate division Zixibacteria bacterium]